MGRLGGKVAIITGSSKGLGAAIAEGFAREGASVVVNYSSSKEEADRLVAAIARSGRKSIAVRASMREREEVASLFKQAHEAFGKLDILVNNAGIYDFQPIEKVNLEHFRKHFELNVLGYLYAIQEAVTYFGSNGGVIVNMGSTVTSFGPVNASVYTASKGAVDGLTRALSNELGSRKIRVNAIKPGVVDTEGVQAGGFLHTEFSAEVTARTPLGRLGKPEDIVPAAIYFASSESEWITGETLFIAGGHR